MTTSSALNLTSMWKKWQEHHDVEAADELIKEYMPIVDYHVSRMAAGLPSSVSKDDLKSHGLMGLYDALTKFDVSRDLKFDTYASFRVKGAILDGLRKEDWLPRSMREKAKKIEATAEQLEQQYQRNVSAEEVAQALEMDEKEVLTIQQESLVSNLLSMDEEAKDGNNDERLSYTIEDKNVPSPEQTYIKEEWLDEMVDEIKELNEKEQYVLSLFYQDELTLTEIGLVLNLSTSRISQIHSRALFKLRHVMQKYR